MLDFYLISDESSDPKHPTGLIYVGGIDLPDFQYLFNINIIENEAGYFQDFRWTNKQVLEKHRTLSQLMLNKIKDKPKSEMLLFNILEKAKESGNGLFTFCD